MFLVSNQGEAKPSLIDAMLGSIRRDVNEGEDGRHYQVLGCDAKDPRSVYEDLARGVEPQAASSAAVAQESASSRRRKGCPVIQISKGCGV